MINRRFFLKFGFASLACATGVAIYELYPPRLRYELYPPRKAERIDPLITDASGRKFIYRDGVITIVNVF